MKNRKNIFVSLLSIIFFCLFSFSSCKNNVENTISDSNYINETQKEIVNVVYNDAPSYSSLADLIQVIKPTVVDIYSYGSNFSSAGSGVIIGQSNSSYYVITNHHVIDNALSFTVVTYSQNDVNTTHNATLIGSSPKNDIAVLQIKSDHELSVASIIKDSSTVRVGDEVIAIGNPLGILGGSVTHGIISAKEREVYIDSIGYMSLLQTDAAINSGNSGGALFNTNGLLVGVVNSGYSNYEGLNFAIPCNIAISCFDSIISTYHNQGTNLGYMEGETNIGLSLSSATIFSNSSLSSQCEIIYVSLIDSTGDCKDKNIKDYSSFSIGKYTSFYSVSMINDRKVDSLEEANKTLQNLSAGEKIKFTFTEVNYARTGGFISQTVYYLTENTITIEIDLTQFIYSMSN